MGARSLIGREVSRSGFHSRSCGGVAWFLHLILAYGGLSSAGCGR